MRVAPTLEVSLENDTRSCDDPRELSFVVRASAKRTLHDTSGLSASARR